MKYRTIECGGVDYALFCRRKGLYILETSDSSLISIIADGLEADSQPEVSVLGVARHDDGFGALDFTADMDFNCILDHVCTVLSEVMDDDVRIKQPNERTPDYGDS